MTLPRLEADLILHGGTVLCMNAARTRASAVAVRGTRIVAVGNAELLALAGRDTRVIDLHGRTAMPGFIEGHVHAEWYGRDQLTLNFRQCKSFISSGCLAKCSKTSVCNSTVLFSDSFWSHCHLYKLRKSSRRTSSTG